MTARRVEPMPVLLRTAAAVLATAAGAICTLPTAAAAETASLGLHQRAAVCVAVMKPRATALADRLRGGDDGVKPELITLTESGFAFIGTAYKSGLRKAEADRMLADAEKAQQGAGAAELERLYTGCRAEGDRLLAESNVFERALVSDRARARVRKLLAKSKRE